MPSENAIIERAETYLRKLSCGVNPLTGELLPEGDACKQERISKCLAYVASLLQKQLDHSDIAGQDSTQAATTAKVGKPEKSEKAEKKAAKEAKAETYEKPYMIAGDDEDEGEEADAEDAAEGDAYVVQPLNKGKTWIGWISSNNGGKVSIS